MCVYVCVQSFLDARQDFLNVADAVVRAPLLWRASYVQELGLLDQVRQRQHTKMVMSCCTKQNKTKQNGCVWFQFLHTLILSGKFRAGGRRRRNDVARI